MNGFGCSTLTILHPFLSIFDRQNLVIHFWFQLLPPKDLQSWWIRFGQAVDVAEGGRNEEFEGLKNGLTIAEASKNIYIAGLLVCVAPLIDLLATFFLEGEQARSQPSRAWTAQEMFVELDEDGSGQVRRCFFFLLLCKVKKNAPPSPETTEVTLEEFQNAFSIEDTRVECAGWDVNGCWMIPGQTCRHRCLHTGKTCENMQDDRVNLSGWSADLLCVRSCQQVWRWQTLQRSWESNIPNSNMQSSAEPCLGKIGSMAMVFLKTIHISMYLQIFFSDGLFFQTFGPHSIFQSVFANWRTSKFSWITSFQFENSQSPGKW